MVAIIIVLATYSDYRRGLMEQAAQATGFREVELREAPMAVAIASAHQRGIREGTVVLISDMGEGICFALEWTHQRSPYSGVQS